MKISLFVVIAKKIVVAKGGNMSNLLTHLKNHHPMKHTDAKKENEGKSE